MSRYSEVSKQIMALFRQYDPNMLAASVDEAYLKQVFSPVPASAGEGELFLTV
jgi:nucleotidyltransferase/DNA polymerase involved in DNA repair